MNTTMVYTIKGTDVLTIELRNREFLIQTVLREKDCDFIAIIPTQLNVRRTQ